MGGDEDNKTHEKQLKRGGARERNRTNRERERETYKVMCRARVAPPVKHPFSSHAAHEGIHYKTAPGGSLVLMHLLVY